MICLDHENFDLGLEIVEIDRPRGASAMLQVQRGVLLVMKGLFAQAEQAFETRPSAAPRERASDDRARHGVDADRPARSRRRSAAAANAVNPKDPIVFHTLGLALMRAGADPEASGDEAVQAFRSAVRLDPALGGARRARQAPAQARRGRPRGRASGEGGGLDPTSAAPATRWRRRTAGSAARAAGIARARQPAQRAGARRRHRSRAQTRCRAAGPRGIRGGASRPTAVVRSVTSRAAMTLRPLRWTVAASLLAVSGNRIVLTQDVGNVDAATYRFARDRPGGAR